VNWRPRAELSTARARAAMLQRVRRFFGDAGVMEVCTPVLGKNAVTDPCIESIRCLTGRGPAYLQTSPEYFMKRLLAAGYPDIYQVGPAFRDGEAGRLHAPEFTMVEWYRLGMELDAIIDDAVSLLQSMVGNDRLDGVDRLTYTAAFQRHLGLDPLDTDTGQIADSIDADDALRASIGSELDAWLDLALSTCVAPRFSPERLTVLHHYPASQAALALLDPEDDRLALRFELFVGHTEIANGYVELTDADEQLRRFESDQQKRRAAGLAVPAVDEALILALKQGVPPCAGVAMGLDRVLMIDEGLETISEAQSFSLGDRE
jgi:lysyl-tRNA synthetase class 2